MLRSNHSGLGIFVFAIFILCIIRADGSPHPTLVKEVGSHAQPIINPFAGNAAGFGYGGQNPKGPQNWGTLKKEWRLCKDGKKQSPIEIWEKNAAQEIVNDLVVNYKPANATIENEEHAISVHFIGDAGSIQINKTKYMLKQYHWHHPAEHLVNGIRYDLELHMVHKTSDLKKIAVVGYLHNVGPPESFLTKVTPQITSLIDKKKVMSLGVIDPRTVKKANFTNKADLKFFRYIGSLSTPPCYEDVIWNLHKKVHTASLAQVNLLKNAVFDYAVNNARPIQSLNGRRYKLHGD